MARARTLRTLTLLLLIAVGSACTVMQEAPPPVSQAKVEPTLLEDRAVMSDGFELPVESWRPDGDPVAVVLALHGFNDYHNAFAGVGPSLAERGILTYAYDQRGFGTTALRGRWGGARRMVQDARDMIALLRARHPGKPVYLLGESMGGAVSIAAESLEPSVDGVVLVAPAVWARKTMPWYQRAALAFARSIAPGWTPTGRSLGRRASDNIPMLRAMGRDPLVIHKTRIDSVAGLADLMDLALASAPRLRTPTLVLYGENDQIVPKRPTCRMLQSLPEDANWRLALYPGGYHMLTRDLRGQVVVDDIAHWILNRTAPLPSGQQASPDRWARTLCDAS